MADPTLITLPRFDDERARARFRHDVARVAPRGTPVLVTPFWPSRPLAPPWIDHLTECVHLVNDHMGGPSLLAELPPALFEQLARDRRPQLLDATTGLVDQLFSDDGRRPPGLRGAKKLLSVSAPERILQRLQEVGIVEHGHFELPSGRHSNTNIKFGDFETVDGGHGLAAFMTTFLARRLRAKAPGMFVYWGGPMLTLMVETLASHLRRGPGRVDVIALDGDYENLSIDERVFDSLGADRSVVAIGDVVASAGLSGRIASLLYGCAAVRPSAIAAFVALSCAIEPLRKFASRYSVSLEIAAEVPGALWPEAECPRCRDCDKPVKVRAEARRDVKVFGPLAYQPPRARVIGSAIAAGQIGARKDEDPRHLHDSYIRPGTSTGHMDALLDDTFVAKLEELDFDYLMYHDTSTANAMVARIRRARFTRQFGEQRLRRRDEHWDLRQPIPRDAKILFIDDGANMGRAILQALDEIERATAYASGILIFEDKMPEWAHRAVQRASARAGPNNTAAALLFVHRSPHTQEGNLDGTCRHCDFLRLATLLAGLPNAPEYRRSAYENLAEALVWEGRVNAPIAVDVVRGDNAVEQLNALLLAKPKWLPIEGSLRLMNFIITDFLPDVRDLARSRTDSSLSATLSMLDERWLERALLWLAPHEIDEAANLTAGSSDLKLSAALGRIHGAGNPGQLTLALRQTVGVVSESPVLGATRYQDVAEHLLMATVPLTGRANLETVMSGLESAGGALAGFREDLEGVTDLLWKRGAKSDGPLFALVIPHGIPQVDPDQGLLEALRRDHWVLDASGDRATFFIADRRDDLEEETALVLAAVAANRSLHTTAMRKFLKDARSSTSVRNRRQRFARLCTSVRAGAFGGAFTSSPVERSTPMGREENEISLGGMPGLLIWRDADSPPWSAITQIVFGVPRSRAQRGERKSAPVHPV